ncbi:hypothetical protein [Agromyces humi]|uniref:hypothetical protein n=1 Tax=Agromyces humi TaxID=1766800 RepID=UPI00135BC75E|nr:hypothetical protein [Agromyces humi]
MTYASTFEHHGADYAIIHIDGREFRLLEQRQEHWGTTNGIYVTTLEADPSSTPTILANIARRWIDENPATLDVGVKVKVGSLYGVFLGRDSGTCVVALEGRRGPARYPARMVRPA